MSSNKKRKYPYSVAQTVHSFDDSALDQTNVESRTISDSISADGRRLRRETVPVYTPPSKPSQASSSSHPHGDAPEFESSYDSYVHQITAEDVRGTRAQAQTKSRRNNYFVSTVRASIFAPSLMLNPPSRNTTRFSRSGAIKRTCSWPSCCD